MSNELGGNAKVGVDNACACGMSAPGRQRSSVADDFISAALVSCALVHASCRRRVDAAFLAEARRCAAGRDADVGPPIRPQNPATSGMIYSLSFGVRFAQLRCI